MFRKQVVYQNTFYRVLERARHDPYLYRQIWNNPVKTLTDEGLNELDVVDFLRQIQNENLTTDAGWGDLGFPIQDLGDTPV